MTSKFIGTGVALATPMLSDYSIDFTGFGRLIDHVIAGGVDYLVLLGTTGESPTISWNETRKLIDFTSEHLNGRVPLVLGLGGNDTSALIEKIKEIEQAPIDAILSASPYYSKPTQEGIYHHYHALAEISNFPILIYNVPHRTSSNILAETTLRLANDEQIIGIKEASGDLMQCSILARDKPTDFLLLSGDDLLSLPILSLGGNGVISVIANAYPFDFSQMINYALKGDYSNASRIHANLVERFRLSNLEGNPSSIKAALEALGVCGRTVRLPLMAASDELVSLFRNTN